MVLVHAAVLRGSGARPQPSERTTRRYREDRAAMADHAYFQRRLASQDLRRRQGSEWGTTDGGG